VKKFFLILFILVDVIVIAGAAFMIYSTVNGKHRGFNPMLTKMTGMPLPGAAKPQAILPSTGPAAVIGSGPALTPASVPLTPATPYRNIAFTYKNVKAKQVLIRADFTGWKGVPMKRDAAGLWSYAAQLTPGDYAYCFTVDDKIIKDPASKHSKRIAQTMVSAITVEKAPVKVSP
jgi:hypothetical protein